MESRLKVLWPDGRESDFVEDSQVLAWYQDGYLKDSSLVFDSARGRWMPLGDLLHERNHPSTVEPQTSPSASGPTTTGAEEVDGLQATIEPHAGARAPSASNVPTPGETEQVASADNEIVRQLATPPPIPRSAPEPVNDLRGPSKLGIVLYAVLILVSIVLSESADTGSTGHQETGALVAFDLVIVVNLLRRHANRHAWAMLAAFRLLAGALVLPFYDFSPSSALSPHFRHGLDAVFILPLSLSLMSVAVLLVSASPSRTRRWTCLGAFLLGLVLLPSLPVLVFAVSPKLAFERALKGQTLTSVEWQDAVSGVAVRPQAPWVQLSPTNTVVPAPNAKAVFAEPQEQQILTVVNESVSDQQLGTSGARLDRYLELVIADRQKALPQYVETSRVDTRCGAFSARRAVVSFKKEGRTYSGALTVFDDGWGLWVLSLVAPPSTSRDALVQSISSLERSVESTKSEEQRIDEEARGAASQNHMFSMNTAKALCYEIHARRLGSSEAMSFGNRVSNDGLRLLSAAEQSEYQALLSRAIDLLTPQERTDLESGLQVASEAMGSESQVAATLQSTLSRILNKALDALSAKDRARFQALIEKGILAALEGAKSGSKSGP